MKKSLFLLGIALVSACSVWADDVIGTGVSYTSDSGTTTVSTSKGTSTITGAEITISDCTAKVISTRVDRTSTTVTYKLSNPVFTSTVATLGDVAGSSVTSTDRPVSNKEVAYSVGNSRFEELKDYIVNNVTPEDHDGTDKWLTYDQVCALGDDVLSVIGVVYEGDYCGKGWSLFYDPEYEDDYAALLYYYSPTERKGIGAKKCTGLLYAVESITESTTVTTIPVTVEKYTYSQISTGIDFSPVVNLTIGSSITSIAEGAFASASNLKSISLNPNKYFAVDSNGFLYTANYQKLIAVPATIAGTTSSQKEYTLEENTAAVAENALANVNYVTLYSIERISQPTLGGTGNILTTNTTELLQGTKNYDLTSNAFIYTGEHNGQEPVGDVTRQNLLDLISGLSANADVAYIDLTTNKVVFKQHDLGEITGLKNNCLLYLPAGITATGNNVIIDGKCKNLVLTDKKTFYAPYAFEVTGTVKYTGRTFTEGVYGTLVLPFSIVPATSISIDGVASKYGKAFRVAMLDSYDSEGNIKFQNQGSMPANVPLLIKPLTSFSELVVSDPDGITIPSTLKNDPMEYSVGTGDASAMFAGTYTQGKSKLTATETTASQDATRYPAGSSAWILSATTGNMKKVTSGKTVNLGSFRGMFVITDPVAASAKPCFRVFDYADTEEGEEDIAIEEDQTTEIQSEILASTSVNVESQCGKLIVSANSTKVNVASVSGTTYYSGEINGQKSFDLPSGVYVVNGKKYIVK